MPIIPQKDRFQMSFSSLEETIAQANPVRFIDAFVDKSELDKVGFNSNTVKAKGIRCMAQAQKHVLMAALTYKLKKFLKFDRKKFCL